MYETSTNPSTHVYGNSAATRSPDPVDTSSRIRDGISQAEQILSELHEAISYLEKRLDTVVSPVPPSVATPTNKTGSSGPPASHVHGRLVILNEGYYGAVQRLRELMQRIEV